MAFPSVNSVRAVLGEEELPDGTTRKRLASVDGRCFEFLRTLGPALMGEVKLAVECERDAAGAWQRTVPARCVAIKRVYKECILRGVTLKGVPVLESPLHEIRVQVYLSQPGHPNVARLLSVLEDDECLFIVQEYCDAEELFNQVAARGGSVPEAVAREYMWAMVQGAAYMHARNVGHRDLSLENAMLATDPAAAAAGAGVGLLRDAGGSSSSGSLPTTPPPTTVAGGARGGAPAAAAAPPPTVAKLIDFGLSVALPPAGLILPGTTRQVGKLRYMPPEMHELRPHDPQKVDCWCLGVCLFVLLFGVYPYQAPSPTVCPYFAAIAQPNGLVTLLTRWRFTERVSPEAVDLLARMLTVNAAARPTLQAVAAHPFFNAVRGGPAAGGSGAAPAVQPR